MIINELASIKIRFLGTFDLARAVAVDPVTKACLDKTVGVKDANKIVSTSYKASRMEKGRETIIWTISSVKQSEITI